MQKVAIFLRKDKAINRFRETILETLKLPFVNNALLCSGFFQHSKIYKSAEDFKKTMNSRIGSPINLNILGIYAVYNWQQSYNYFINQLKQYNPYGYVNIQGKVVPGQRWHAKIFIAKQDDIPVVAIIGSSNITSRAFGINRPFNYECDVIFWDANNSQVNKMMESIFPENERSDFSDVIITNYDAKHHTSKKSLNDKILDLEQEILAKAKDM